MGVAVAGECLACPLVHLTRVRHVRGAFESRTTAERNHRATAAATMHLQMRVSVPAVQRLPRRSHRPELLTTRDTSIPHTVQQVVDDE